MCYQGKRASYGHLGCINYHRRGAPSGEQSGDEEIQLRLVTDQEKKSYLYKSNDMQQIYISC